MTNKYFILLALLLVALAQCVFAQGSVQILVPDDTTGYTKPVSANNPLPVDADVTIGSITMETTIVPITEWETQTVTLVANTAQDIVSNITGSRRFIALKTHTADAEFWVAFNASATLSAGLFAVDSLYIEAPDSVSVSLIASEAISISVTEGGY